jgi:hypothetical protein
MEYNFTYFFITDPKMLLTKKNLGRNKEIKPTNPKKRVETGDYMQK